MFTLAFSDVKVCQVVTEAVWPGPGFMLSMAKCSFVSRALKVTPKSGCIFIVGEGECNSASETQKAWKSYFSKHLGSQVLLKSFYIAASCLESRNEVNLVCLAQLDWKPSGRGAVCNHMLVQRQAQWGPDFNRSLQGQRQYKKQWYEVKEEILTHVKLTWCRAFSVTFPQKCCGSRQLVRSPGTWTQGPASHLPVTSLEASQGLFLPKGISSLHIKSGPTRQEWRGVFAESDQWEIFYLLFPCVPKHPPPGCSELVNILSCLGHLTRAQVCQWERGVFLELRQSRAQLYSPDIP